MTLIQSYKPIQFALILTISVFNLAPEKAFTDGYFLTEEEIIKKTIIYSPALAAVGKRIEAQQHKKYANLAQLYFPSVNIGFSSNYSGNKNINEKLSDELSSGPGSGFGSLFGSPTFQNSINLAADATLNYPIYNAGRIKIQTKLENLAMEFISLDEKELQRNILFQVRQSYLVALMARNAIQILSDISEKAKDVLDKTKERARIGLVIDPDLQIIRLQINYENTLPAIDDMNNRYREALNTIYYLTGLPLLKSNKAVITREIIGSLKINAELFEFDLKNVLNNVATWRTDIRKMSLQLQQTELNNDMVKANLKPVVSIFGKTGLSYLFISPAQTIKSKMDFNLQGGLSVNLNLLEGLNPRSSTHQNSKYLKKSKESLRLSKKALIEQIKSEVINTHMNLLKSKNNLKNKEKINQLSEKNYRAIKSRYDQGIVDIIQYIDGQNAYSQAQFSLLQEKFNYKTTALQLAYISGMDLSAVVF